MDDERFKELLEEVEYEIDKEPALLRALCFNKFSEIQLEIISKLEVVKSSSELTRLLEPLDQESRDQLIQDRTDSVDCFSGANKQGRERHVVCKFLELMGLAYDQDGLVSPKEDPPDIIVAGACFELKEIMDEDRARHKEYKLALASAKRNLRPIELYKLAPVRTVSHVELGERLKGVLKELQDKYPNSLRKSLDLLFYINLMDVYGYTGPLPVSSEFEEFGWRSISAVTGGHAWVYHAIPSAPDWVSQGVGKLRRRAEGNI